MAKKIFKYRGKTVDELKLLPLKDFMNLLPARERRSLSRGFTDEQKILLREIELGKTKIKTHVRDLIILPNMIGLTFEIYTGSKFESVVLTDEMIGHRLGEFANTRRSLLHSSPGVGATKSNSSVSVR